jgi:hypothetical protein
MTSEFHRYPQSSKLRSELERLASGPLFFSALKSCDSRIAVGQPEDVPAFSIPTGLRKVWALAATVQFNGDSILYSWRESEKTRHFLADVLVQQRGLMIPIGEMGDGDYFLIDPDGFVNWWSHEEDLCSPCGDIWQYIAEHASWRCVHFKNEK